MYETYSKWLGQRVSVEDDEDPKTMQLLEDWDQWLTDCNDN